MRLQRNACGWWLAIALALGCSEASPPDALATAAEPTAEGPRRAPSPVETSERCQRPEPETTDFAERLAASDFAALERDLQQLQDDLDHELACERRYVIAFNSLTWSGQVEHHARYVAAYPDSWIAHALRGAGLVGAGIESRGTALSKDVSDEQWQGMREAFEQARASLARSLEIDPANLIANAALMQLLRYQGPKDEVPVRLAALLEHRPANYYIRTRAMAALEPRWGGSFQAMAAIAEEAQQHAEENPRLYGLPGFVAARVAFHALWDEKDEEAALAGFLEALRYAHLYAWYQQAVRLTWESAEKPADFRRVVELSTEWMKSRGEDGLALSRRAAALNRLGNPDGARRDHDRAVELAPWHTWIGNNRAYFLESTGEPELAAEQYRVVLEHAPDSSYALGRLMKLLAHDPQARDEALALAGGWVDASPESVEAWYWLGRLRHEAGHARAAETLEAYLALADRKGDGDERIALARRLLNPELETAAAGRRMPGLEHLGLAGSGGE